ncbi:MAG: hypothetical protein SFX18_00125 [Pirellulales bacterium]|nr:hypothetical protein [Pirellulales bacterium]
MTVELSNKSVVVLFGAKRPNVCVLAEVVLHIKRAFAARKNHIGIGKLCKNNSVDPKIEYPSGSGKILKRSIPWADAHGYIPSPLRGAETITSNQASMNSRA